MTLWKCCEQKIHWVTLTFNSSQVVTTTFFIWFSWGHCPVDYVADHAMAISSAFTEHSFVYVTCIWKVGERRKTPCYMHSFIYMIVAIHRTLDCYCSPSRTKWTLVYLLIIYSTFQVLKIFRTPGPTACLYRVCLKSWWKEKKFMTEPSQPRTYTRIAVQFHCQFCVIAIMCSLCPHADDVLIHLLYNYIVTIRCFIFCYKIY